MRVGSPSWGSERGPCAANVELPAIPRLVGRSSVSMPATTPNSAHLRPTRGPDARRTARMAVPRRGPGRLCPHRTVLRSGPADDPPRACAAHHSVPSCVLRALRGLVLHPIQNEHVPPGEPHPNDQRPPAHYGVYIDDIVVRWTGEDSADQLPSFRQP